MVSAILAEVWPYILGVATLVIGWFTAKHQGKKQAQEQSKSERLESMKIAKEIKENVQAASDDELIVEFDRLHNKNRR